MNIFAEFQTYFCLDSQRALLNSEEGKSKGIFREQIEDKVGVFTREDPREGAQGKGENQQQMSGLEMRDTVQKARLGENKRDRSQEIFCCCKLNY